MTTLIPKYDQGSTNAINRAINLKLAETISVLDFGADNTGATDSTTAIQNAITFCGNTKQLFFPSGSYLVTSTLNLVAGSNLIGTNQAQGEQEYSTGVTSSTILFQPTTVKDLFLMATPGSGFNGKLSISNLMLIGNTTGVTTGANTNSQYALNLSTVIYGNFSNLEIRQFRGGINCFNTINNRFCNIRIANSSVVGVQYSGTSPPTTDVWEQCSFTNAPTGVILTTGIAIRFINCLFESLANYGVDIAMECAHIHFVACYGENIPLTNASGAMFHVGYNGSVSSNNNIIIIQGGKYQGNDTTTQGTWLAASTVQGALLSSVAVSAFTNVITTGSNTALYAICCAGLQSYSCTTIYNDFTKISGFLDYESITSAGGPVGNFVALQAATLSSPNTILTLNASARVVPFADNTTSLGYAGQRWSVVYAGTGTINTSDATQKQQIASLTSAEQATAKLIKGLIKTFKFNDAVTKKGEEARTHIGVMAQDVQAAFTANGLDANKYSLFCSDTWYTLDDKIVPQGTEGAVEVNQLGVRYEELLAFVIAAL